MTKSVLSQHWSSEENANRRITVREVANEVGKSFDSCQANFTDVLGMKSTAAYCKIAKFWEKTTSHGHRSGDVDDVQRRSRFAQKGHNWWLIMYDEPCMTMTYNQIPIISMEAPRRAEIEKSTSSSVKCGCFAHCFLRLQWRGASRILATRSYGQ